MSWLLLAALMVFPMLLAIVAVQQALSRLRLRRTVGATVCGRCGAVLGGPALDRAEAAWRAEMARWQPAHPGYRLRVVRRLWALCGACGAGHDFDVATRRFVPLEAGGSGQVAP